jgi:hypothetical protein
VRVSTAHGDGALVCVHPEYTHHRQTDGVRPVRRARGEQTDLRWNNSVPPV